VKQKLENIYTIKKKKKEDKREINKSLAYFRGIFSLKSPAIQIGYLLCSKLF
jgi:hypothetical protein